MKFTVECFVPYNDGREYLQVLFGCCYAKYNPPTDNSGLILSSGGAILGKSETAARTFKNIKKFAADRMIFYFQCKMGLLTIANRTD